MKLLCLGPAGTFTHIAALKYQPQASITFVNSITQGLKKLKDGSFDAFFAPAENLINGTVRETIDGLYYLGLHISSSFTMPINHCLMSNSSHIKTIYSHPQAIAQCRQYLEKNYGDATFLPCQSTAEACQKAQTEANSAAIAHKNSADIYHLPIIQTHIEDEPHNQTTFYVVTNELPTEPKDHSAMVVKPKLDASGLLFSILEVFKIHDINLCKIESRPAKTQLGHYLFYIDFIGDWRHESAQQALQKLRALNMVEDITILGGY